MSGGPVELEPVVGVGAGAPVVLLPFAAGPVVVLV